MKKKAISLILALVLCLTLAAPALAADSDFTIDEYGILTKYNGSGGAVTIPDGVVKIGRRAFYERSRVTSVTIPSSVTSIGEEAFTSCTGLKSVTIPNSVTEIGNEAFMHCKNLSSVTIPDSVFEIGRQAFAGCHSLNSVTISNGVVIIGRSAFDWCTGLTGVTIPDSVASIGMHAFSNCTNLKSVTIPNSVTNLGDYAFHGCTGLSSVTISDSVTSIGADTFIDCTSLKSVTIPSSVTEIKWTAFHKCDNITDVYYGGSEAQWKNVKIARDNGNLPNATVHYNSSGPAAPEAPSVPAAPTVGGFSDVTVNDYFAEPVKWAVEKGVTAGTSDSTFSPSQTCTQAHILTFLWRAKGEPAPTVDNPFSDVKAGDYYYNAALWAYEKGLISGGSFGADSPCTRAQTVTYQWKLAGSPDAPAASFTDVSASADYAAAVAWAVEKGVTSGTSATTFSPDDTCTRGQIVTFLYRDLV